VFGSDDQLYDISDDYYQNFDDDVDIFQSSQFPGTDWTVIEGILTSVDRSIFI